jgi:hypothetical protein
MVSVLLLKINFLTHCTFLTRTALLSVACPVTEGRHIPAIELSSAYKERFCYVVQWFVWIFPVRPGFGTERRITLGLYKSLSPFFILSKFLKYYTDNSTQIKQYTDITLRVELSLLRKASHKPSSKIWSPQAGTVNSYCLVLRCDAM